MLDSSPVLLNWMLSVTPWLIEVYISNTWACSKTHPWQQGRVAERPAYCLHMTTQRCGRGRVSEWGGGGGGHRCRAGRRGAVNTTKKRRAGWRADGQQPWLEPRESLLAQPSSPRLSPDYGQCSREGTLILQSTVFSSFPLVEYLTQLGNFLFPHSGSIFWSCCQKKMSPSTSGNVSTEKQVGWRVLQKYVKGG